MDCRNCKYKDKNSLALYCKKTFNITNSNALTQCFCLAKRYLLKYMTSGGYSNIYYAYDLDTKRIVLIKECYIQGEYKGRNANGLLIPRHGSEDRLSKKLTLFIKETQKLNILESIGILPKMYDFYIPDLFNAFLIMEYLDGCSIFNASIKTSRQLLNLFKPVVKGICEMHKYNIIHRDLRSHNLLLVNNEIKILDLGIARTIYQSDSEKTVLDIMTDMLETSVSVDKPIEHQNHSFQDSRTDVYSLAMVIKEAYRKFDIAVPTAISSILEAAIVPSIDERLDSNSFYKALYKKNVVLKTIFMLVLLFPIGISVFLSSIVYGKKIKEETSFRGYHDYHGYTKESIDDSDNMQYEEMLIQREKTLINQIESTSGYKLDRKYIGYADFDADGNTELFALAIKETDETQYDTYNESEWIIYGEVWFTDGNNTIKLEEIGPDNWQGGGYYKTSLLQFGDVYHWQLHKWYGGITLSDGPSNIYAYEDGIPIKTKVGYINNFTLVDGGSDKGVYYSTVTETSFTTLHGRTWHKTYVYYRDRMYYTYESKLLDWIELKTYENINEIVCDGLRKIFFGDEPSDTEELLFELDTFTIDEKMIYYYTCKMGAITKYVTFFNAYENSSGRIYLNMNIWNKKEDFMNSKIWEDNEWNNTYSDPIDVSADFEDEGANIYITFTLEKNNLKIEEITYGFWDMEGTNYFGNIFNEWENMGGIYHYHNQYGIEVKGDYEVDGVLYHFNETGELEGEVSGAH